MKITLQELNFSALVRYCRDFYHVLDANRDRLVPYFFWAGRQVTPDFMTTFAFVTLYILDTKYKYMLYKVRDKEYDKPFIILNGNKVTGMIGLDKINPQKNNAEVWYWVSSQDEGKGVATNALKQVENYSINKLKLDSLYTCVVRTNEKSKAMMQRNKYHITDIKYGVPISVRNPRLADIVHYKKQLIR